MREEILTSILLVVVCSQAPSDEVKRPPSLPERAWVRLGDYNDYKRREAWDVMEPGFYGLAFSPDSKYLITGLLQIWDVESKKLSRTLDHFDPDQQEVRKRGGYHPNGVCMLRWIQSEEVVGMRFDQAVFKFSLGKSNGTKFITNGIDQGIHVPSLSFSPDQARLVIVFNSRKPPPRFIVARWPSLEHEFTMNLKTPEHTFYITVNTFTQDGNRLIVGDKTLFLWNFTGKGHAVPFQIPSHHDWLGAVLVTPDGRYVLATEGSSPMIRDRRLPEHPRVVRIAELATGREVDTFHGTVPIAVSPDGRLLAHGSAGQTYEKEICIVDLHTMKEVVRFQHEKGFVSTLVFSPNGKWLASAGNSGTALLWKTEQFYKPLPKAEELAAAQLQRCWNDLEKEPKLAQIAIRQLALSPKRVPAFVAEEFAKERPKPELIQKVVAELDSDQFRVREQASRELAKLGTHAASEWLKLLDKKPSEDARQRIEKLQRVFCFPGDGFVEDKTILRHLRAIEVLERIGTPEAVKVLEEFTKFDARTFEGRDARAALERLAKKSK